MKKLVYFIDFETHLFKPGLQCPPIVCMSMIRNIDEEPSLMLWKDILRTKVLHNILTKCTEGKAIIVAQYAAFDMTCIVANNKELAHLVWKAYQNNAVTCTKIREKLLDIAQGELKKRKGKERPYSLGSLVREKFRHELDKDLEGWRLRYQELEDIRIEKWPERAVTYAKEDAKYGLALYLEQERRAASMEYLLPTEFMESRADFALRLMSAWGIQTNNKKISELESFIISRMNELESNLISSGLMRENLKNGKRTKNLEAIRQAVLNSWPVSKKLEVPLTEKGAIKTDKETLEQCEDKGLQNLVEFNALQKTESTYITALKDGVTKPIHPMYNVLVSSSRTSCSKPNLQNQPRLPGIRECFIPRPDCVFIACDYDSQEMRTLAQSCLDIVGSSKLAERYKADVHYDPHQEFADFCGCERQHAKIANFGLPGGMGVNGLIRYAKGYGQVWDEEYAGQIRKAWFSQWPEMQDYFNHISSLVGQASCGNVKIPQSGFVRGACGYCDAANTYFQSLAAHASKSALFEVSKKCYDKHEKSILFGSRPIVFVHDEIIIEAPRFACSEIAKEFEKIMIDAMQLWTPDVPVSASATAMEYWSKEAELTYNMFGDLVPWKGENNESN